MEISPSDLFWNAHIEDLKKGYIRKGDNIVCLICGETFEEGRIYDIDSKLYDAEKAAKLHIEKVHGSMLEYILNMNSVFTGISEAQKAVISLISKGMTDKEIAKEKGLSQSTVRNHRYKLREKERQAKMFLTMMELLSDATDKSIKVMDNSVICDAHKGATTIDDRYNITDKEKKKVIPNYMDEVGSLKVYPSKEKKKIIVFEEIMKNFKANTIYTEKEINRILKRVYEEDYITLRRALIEYGFLDRAKDGSSYWVKE